VILTAVLILAYIGILANKILDNVQSHIGLYDKWVEKECSDPITLMALDSYADQLDPAQNRVRYLLYNLGK
jgi:hypothetical protein